jgi:hypothetical protein
MQKKISREATRLAERGERVGGAVLRLRKVEDL